MGGGVLHSIFGPEWDVLLLAAVGLDCCSTMPWQGAPTQLLSLLSSPLLSSREVGPAPCLSPPHPVHHPLCTPQAFKAQLDEFLEPLFRGLVCGHRACEVAAGACIGKLRDAIGGQGGAGRGGAGRGGAGRGGAGRGGAARGTKLLTDVLAGVWLWLRMPGRLPGSCLRCMHKKGNHASPGKMLRRCTAPHRPRRPRHLWGAAERGAAAADGRQRRRAAAGGQVRDAGGAGRADAAVGPAGLPAGQLPLWPAVRRGPGRQRLCRLVWDPSVLKRAGVCAPFHSFREGLGLCLLPEVEHDSCMLCKHEPCRTQSALGECECNTFGTFHPWVAVYAVHCLRTLV